jgi:hypothetical protein
MIEGKIVGRIGNLRFEISKLKKLVQRAKTLRDSSTD